MISGIILPDKYDETKINMIKLIFNNIFYFSQSTLVLLKTFDTLFLNKNIVINSFLIVLIIKNYLYILIIILNLLLHNYF